MHLAFADAVRNSGIPGLEAETTWFGGLADLRYGIAGSIRTDAVLRAHDDRGTARVIWHVKTGSSTLAPGRLDRIRSGAGAGSDIPIIELNVNRGVMIKEVLLGPTVGHAHGQL